jgi:hypothetical protein
LYLHRAGIDVEIFERAEEIRELGVGINMLPHAVEALTELGLLADLDAAGIRTHELIYANRLGQVVWQELRGTDAGHGHPQISIHRGQLLGPFIVPLSRGSATTPCEPAGRWADSSNRRMESLRSYPAGTEHAKPLEVTC